MVPSNVYSKALYDLAEEIDKNEGCVTCSSVLVEGAAINPASLLPDERECCGTFPRTPHRSTCKNYRGKKGGAA